MIRHFTPRVRVMIVAIGVVLAGVVVVSSVLAAGGTSPAVARACPATRAKSLPKSSPWSRNGWLSPQNKALSGRIARDQRYLARHGILLTQWGPDSISGKIKIYLTHYTSTAAQALYARYGCAVIVVTTSLPRPSY